MKSIRSFLIILLAVAFIAGAISTGPAKINGFWYVSYTSSLAWGHFETK